MGIEWSDVCKILRTVPGIHLYHIFLLQFLLCAFQFNGQPEKTLLGLWATREYFIATTPKVVIICLGTQDRETN